MFAQLHQLTFNLDTKPILSTEETVTTTTTTVTKTRKTYVSPSPSPTKASSIKTWASSVTNPLKQGAVLQTSSTKPSIATVQSPSLPPPSYSPSSQRAPAHLSLVTSSPVRASPVRASSSKPVGVRPVRTVHPVPHPDEVRRPAPGEHVQGYYVVFRGRECGIFYTWYVRSLIYITQC